MNRLMTFAVVSMLAFMCIAKPGHAPIHHSYGPRVQHRLLPPRPHHTYHSSHILPTLTTAIIGSAILNAIAPTPTITVVQPTPVVQHVVQPVVQPIVRPVQVWVPGYYQDVVQPNGTVLRTYVPGHYEYR